MPLDMPDYGLVGVTLDPDLGISTGRSEGGLIITSRRSDPFLTGRLTTRVLEPPEHADMRAFLYKAVDLNYRIDMLPPRAAYDYPPGYTADNWPMTGNAVLKSVTDLRHVVVGSLVAGMILKRGTRLSFLQGDLVCQRWIAEDIVVSSAISQALEVTPRLPFGIFAANAVVVLERPTIRIRWCRDPGIWPKH